MRLLTIGKLEVNMKKWLSRKLVMVIVAGAVLVIRPEVALYATILGCVYVAAQAWVDRK